MHHGWTHPAQNNILNSNLPWLTKKPISAIWKKQQLFDCMHKSRNQKDWNKYKQHKTWLRNGIKKADRDYLENTLKDCLEEKNSNHSGSSYQVNVVITQEWRLSSTGGNFIATASTRQTSWMIILSDFFSKDDGESPQLDSQPYPQMAEISVTTPGVANYCRWSKWTRWVGWMESQATC